MASIWRDVSSNTFSIEPSSMSYAYIEPRDWSDQKAIVLSEKKK